MSVYQKPKLTDTLNTLLLPLTDRYLLIPNVALAEIIDFVQPKVKTNLPDWFLGNIFWRGISVPLLSFELASGGEFKQAKKYKIAVLNAIAGNSKRKFIAILLRDIPRPIKVSPNLERLSIPPEPLEQAVVKVGDVEASIPNLISLEQKLDVLNLDF